MPPESAIQPIPIKPVSIIRYAGLFLVSHFCGVFIVGALIKYVGVPRPPWVGFWIALAAAYLVSYTFGRRQRRLFTSKETWWLISLCSFYLVIFDIYAEFVSRSKYQPGSNGLPIDDGRFFAIVAIVCLTHVLTMVLFFEFGAPQIMRSSIE
jgi:hypothetical protein